MGVWELRPHEGVLPLHPLPSELFAFEISISNRRDDD